MEKGERKRAVEGEMLDYVYKARADFSGLLVDINGHKWTLGGRLVDISGSISPYFCFLMST